jgi:hypothetical protein
MCAKSQDRQNISKDKATKQIKVDIRQQSLLKPG